MSKNLIKSVESINIRKITTQTPSATARQAKRMRKEETMGKVLSLKKKIKTKTNKKSQQTNGEVQ